MSAHGGPESLPADRDGDTRPAPDRRVVLVHRVGAVVVALIIGVFGALGFVGGLALALVRLFGVSRMTVNRAVRELTAEQVLVRRQGGLVALVHPLPLRLDHLPLDR